MTSRLLAVVALASTGCIVIQASGPLVFENREVPAFTKVSVSDGVPVDITIGAASPVRVAADEDLQPRLVTEVRDGTLFVELENSGLFNSSQGLNVSFSTPHLTQLSLSGGSHVTARGIEEDRLDIDASGGSVLTLERLSLDAFVLDASDGSVVDAEGTTRTIDLQAAGGSPIGLSALPAATAKVDASGGSPIELRVTDRITGSLTGGSILELTGNPVVDVETSGGSSIQRR